MIHVILPTAQFNYTAARVFLAVSVLFPSAMKVAITILDWSETSTGASE
jgi:hypothetical protein